MSGHRKAALALHAVSPEDRQLVLQDLPGQDQALLRRYLEELDALGFDPGAVEDALERPAPSGARDVIRCADPAALGTVLASEPAALAAALLRLETWPWTDAWLQGLAPARRLRVTALLAAPAPVEAPARDALLLERAAAALRALPAPQPQLPAGSALAQLVRQAPPPIPSKPADKNDKATETRDAPPLPPAVPAAEPPKTKRPGKPAIGYDESGAIVPVRSGTAPETYFLYDDIVTLSGLNDWDGVLISLERLLVLAKLEDHIKEFVDANEVKLLSIYETFLKSFGRVPKRLPAAVDNSMPRPFLRAEKIAGVLAMIDGKVTIQEILKRSPLTPLETCSALCQLRRAGVVDVP